MQYYVNIDNSYDGTTGFGTSILPWDWNSFIDHLSGGLATDNKTYYLSGDRVVSDSILSLPVSNGGDDSYKGTGNMFILLAQWPTEGATPWSIVLSAEFGFLEFSGDNTFDNFVLQDGRIQCYSLWLKNTVVDSPYLGGVWKIEDMWINAKQMHSQQSWLYGNFNGSVVLLSGGSNPGLYLQQNTLYMRNTIFVAEMIGFPTNMNYLFIEGSVLDREESDFCADITPSPYYPPKNWMSYIQNPQENWTPPDIINYDISAINSSDINYLSADWNTITATGVISYTFTNKSNSENAGNLYGGRRDGVGALYFPETLGTISAGPTSGYYDDISATTVTMSVEPAAATTLSTKTYYAHYASTNETTATEHEFIFSADLSFPDTIPNPASYSSSKPYQINEEYYVGGYIFSPNKWYQSSRLQYENPLIIFDYPLSANVIPTNSSYIEKTTFQTGENIYFACTEINSTSGNSNLSGAANLIVNLLEADGTLIDTRVFYNPSLPIRDFFYGLYDGDYVIEAWVSHNTSIPEQELYNNATSAAFTVSYSSPLAYENIYVDIDTSNDVNTGYDGTSATPLCWSEFINQIKYGGTGISGTVYRLKGLRDINDFVGINALTAADKQFTIQDWDLLTYGPWVFALNGLYSVNLSKTVLVNGMIYSKPSAVGKIGGSLIIGPCYNMYVVENGIDGTISFAKANGTFGIYEQGQTTATTATFVNNTYYAGCTFFASGGFNDVETDTAYDLYLQDCVFENFISVSSTSFLSAVARIDSCTFAESSAAVQGVFQTVSTDGKEQYNWNAPAHWPLKINDYGYGETLAWIISHRNYFAPFIGITRPPNPGVNAPIYSKYKTGLFGYDRASYIPPSEL